MAKFNGKIWWQPIKNHLDKSSLNNDDIEWNYRHGTFFFSPELEKKLLSSGDSKTHNVGRLLYHSNQTLRIPYLYEA
ncbi:MAG: hypothetical protein P1U70_25410, partial [Saprospiraceae bacterium]|nr:hypothetical protein [Saprospiraceae bacterium]